METEDLLLQYKTREDDLSSISSENCSLENENSHNCDIDRDNAEFIITKGLHIFNFEFQLPAHLPASFVVPDHVPECSGMKAFVVYNIKVEVVNLQHQVTHSRERDILVFRSMDLNQYPKLKDKVTLHKEFHVNECCAPKSKILCELAVNRCAFVPGEIMNVEVSIKNGSTKPIESVQLSLLQNVIARSDKGEKSVQLRLFSIGMGSVSPRRAQVFADTIHIPPVVASGLIGCDIIDVTYSLITQLFILGDKSKKQDFQLIIPITIGSDPIKDASFGGNKEVVPCYALFDYDTGAVIEYVPLKLTSSVHHMMPVYRYYKPRPPQPINLPSSLACSSSTIQSNFHKLRSNNSNPNFSVSQRPSNLLSSSQYRILSAEDSLTTSNSTKNLFQRPSSGPIIIPNEFYQPPNYEVVTNAPHHLYSISDSQDIIQNTSSVLLNSSSIDEEQDEYMSNSPHSCTSVERFHCHETTSITTPSTDFSMRSPAQEIIPMKTIHIQSNQIDSNSLNKNNLNSFDKNSQNKIFSYYLSEESSELNESYW